MDYLGGVAGGTLGYIYGNGPGAVAGYMYGKQHGETYLKKMAPLFSREPPTPKKTPVKRRASISSSSSASKRSRRSSTGSRRSSVMSLGSASQPRSVIRPGVKKASKKARKRVSFKKPSGKKLKVSKTFKLKVEKVNAGDSYKGFLQNTSYGSSQFSITDGQCCFEFGAEGTNGYYFSPAQILNAASILWNGKSVPVVNPAPNIADAGNFNPTTFKCFIKKTWATTVFKNNSQRRIYMKIYHSKSHSDQNQIAPLDDWIQSLSFLTVAAPSVTFSSNPLSTTPFTLHADPRSVDQWKRQWSTECTKVVLEPGQTYDDVISGPSNVMMDLAKFYVSSIYTQINKQCRFSMVAWHYDVCGSLLGGAGRIAPASGETGVPGLVWETNAYYNLELPSVAGFVTPIAAAPPTTAQPLTERRTSYSVYNYGSGAVGAAVDVNIENPVLTTPVLG